MTAAIERLRDVAVRTIKPRLSEPTWQRLRGVRPDWVLGAEEREERRLQRMSLTELAEHFGTDKWGSHYYTPHYERFLGHLRDEEFTLLEIGIGGYEVDGVGGESLRMWKHFFPRAQIVGLDIEDKSWVKEPRIRVAQGSQVDPKVLNRIVRRNGAPLVVIDDGSHRPVHIRETFRLLFPLLPDGAIYAIEDTQTSYWPNWGGNEDPAATDTTMALVKDLLDGLNYEEFRHEHTPTERDRTVVAVHAFHNLVIIEKGRNEEGSNIYGKR